MGYILLRARLVICDLSLSTTDLRLSPRLRGSTAKFVEQGKTVARAELGCLTEELSLARPQSPKVIAIYLGLLPLPEAWLSTCVCHRLASRRRPRGPFTTYLVVFSFVLFPGEFGSGFVCRSYCFASSKSEFTDVFALSQAKHGWNFNPGNFSHVRYLLSK